MRELTPAEEQFSLRLRHVLAGLSTPLSTGGTIRATTSPAITLARETGDPASFTIAPAPEGPATQERLVAQLDGLRDFIRAVPARGKGARRLSEGFETNISEEVLDDIKAQVKRGLLLEATELEFYPWSIDVYHGGGTVKLGTDEPGGATIGKLVVCLLTLFEDGRLLVSTGINKYFNDYFSKMKRGVRSASIASWWGDDQRVFGKKTVFDDKKLAWAAYYAGAQYQVLDVDDGVRVTAVYEIRRRDALNAKNDLPRAVDADEMGRVFDEMLSRTVRNPAFLGAGGRLGYRCERRYASTTAFRGQRRDVPLTGKQIDKLKGRDLMVARTAAKFGFTVYLAAYLFHTEQGDYNDLGLDRVPQKGSPRYGNSVLKMFNSISGCMTQSNVEDYFEGSYRGLHGMDSAAHPNEHAEMWIRDYDQQDEKDAKQRLGSSKYCDDVSDYDCVEWTNFFARFVLFVGVPPFADRGGEACRAVLERTNNIESANEEMSESSDSESSDCDSDDLSANEEMSESSDSESSDCDSEDLSESDTDASY